ncbi:hypothetical protein JCM11251_006293 [Rhodosporidiobolus azoricus]
MVRTDFATEAAHSRAETFDRLFNQTLASQDYATAVLGPCVIGWAGQILLAGVVLGWAERYFSTDLYRRDTLRHKVMLFFALALCLMQSGFNFSLLWYWTTSQDRAAADLVRPTVPDALQPLSVSLLGPLVQCFLAKRAIRLLVARWAKVAATIFFGVVIVLEFVAAIFNVAISLEFHKGRLRGVLLRLATYNLATGIWLWLAAAADVGVTVLLCVVLRKRIAGFNQSTDKKLRALCRLAVQSASYTSVLAVGGAIAAYSAPQNNLLFSSVPYPLWYLLPSCYPIALLTALSSRQIFASSDSSAYAAGTPTLANGNSVSLRPHYNGDYSPDLDATRMSPQMGRGEKRRSRLFGGGGGGTRRDRFGTATGAIQVDKHVSVMVESECGSAEEYPLAPLDNGVAVPFPAARSTASPNRRRLNPDDEDDDESAYRAQIITGRSDRKEIWESDSPV